MSDLTATSFRLSLRREEVRGGTGRGWAPIMATRAPTAMATHAAGGSPGGSWDQGPGLTGWGGEGQQTARAMEYGCQSSLVDILRWCKKTDLTAVLVRQLIQTAIKQYH